MQNARHPKRGGWGTGNKTLKKKKGERERVERNISRGGGTRAIKKPFPLRFGKKGGNAKKKKHCRSTRKDCGRKTESL